MTVSFAWAQLSNTELDAGQNFGTMRNEPEAAWLVAVPIRKLTEFVEKLPYFCGLTGTGIDNNKVCH